MITSLECGSSLAQSETFAHGRGMFVVSESSVEAIHRAYEAGGELSAMVELRRLFPGIADNDNARRCVT